MDTYTIGHLLGWCKQHYDADEGACAFDMIYRYLCPMREEELEEILRYDWSLILSTAQLSRHCDAMVEKGATCGVTQF